MAEETYDGAIPFSVVSGNAAVLVAGEIRWLKTGSGAEFWAYVSTAARSANHQAKYLGNYDNYIRLSVDGDWTKKLKTADGITVGTGTGGATGWVHQKKYEDKSTERKFASAKDTAFTLVVESSGNTTRTVSATVTIQFAIPLFANTGGTVYQIEKAYANVAGVIRDCDEYARVGNEIKGFQ